MKKIIACISLVFAMSAGVTALAADDIYTKDGNSVTYDANGYSTVLIENDTTNEIVFVDQNDAGLNANGTSAKFLLKGDKLADGDYTMTLGGASDGSSKDVNFKVTSIDPVTKPMEMTNKVKSADGSTYDAGFFKTVAVEDCRFIAITANGKTAYFESEFVGSDGGEVAVAIKVTNVPVETTFSLALTNVNE